MQEHATLSFRFSALISSAAKGGERIASHWEIGRNNWERGRLARVDGRLTFLQSGRDARSPKYYAPIGRGYGPLRQTDLTLPSEL